jgi:hypothetical protein
VWNFDAKINLERLHIKGVAGNASVRQNGRENVGGDKRKKFEKHG